MTAYNSNITSTNIPSKRGSSIPRVISDVVDFSSTTNATGDTFDVLPIPANSLVLAAGVDVLTADGAGNSGTIIVGDSIDAQQYVAAATVASTGQMITLDANYAYSSANAIRLTIGTGAINAKVRVWCCVMSLDDGGTLADTGSQTSTFA
jgi:hypothetical protein